MLVSLDTDVINALTHDPALSTRLAKGLRRRFRHDPEFYVTPTTAFENHESYELQKRVDVLHSMEARVMPFSMTEIRELEFRHGNAFRRVREATWPPILVLLKGVDQDVLLDQKQRHLESKSTMKEQVPAIEAHIAIRNERELELGGALTYESYVSIRWHGAIEGFIQGRSCQLDPESLWNQAKSIRAWTCLMLANVYRRATLTPKTRPEGSYTDGGLVSEGAYGDVIVTRDTQLLACGELMNRSLVPEPRIVSLADVS